MNCRKRKRREQALVLLTQEPWICVLCREGINSQASEFEEATFAWPFCGHDMHAKCLWQYALTMLQFHVQPETQEWNMKTVKKDLPCPHCRCHHITEEWLPSLQRMPRCVIQERRNLKDNQARVVKLLKLHSEEKSRIVAPPGDNRVRNDEESVNSLIKALKVLKLPFACPAECGADAILNWDEYQPDESDLFAFVEFQVKEHHRVCPIMQTRAKVKQALHHCLRNYSVVQLEGLLTVLNAPPPTPP